MASKPQQCPSGAEEEASRPGEVIEENNASPADYSPFPEFIELCQSKKQGSDSDIKKNLPEEVGLYGKRLVFTISTEPPYLTGALQSLEESEGLVTLSTEVATVPVDDTDFTTLRPSTNDLDKKSDTTSTKYVGETKASEKVHLQENLKDPHVESRDSVASKDEGLVDKSEPCVVIDSREDIKCKRTEKSGSSEPCGSAAAEECLVADKKETKGTEYTNSKVEHNLVSEGYIKTFTDSNYSCENTETEDLHVSIANSSKSSVVLNHISIDNTTVNKGYNKIASNAESSYTSSNIDTINHKETDETCENPKVHNQHIDNNSTPSTTPRVPTAHTSTQTEGTPLSATVDFYLWERHRLAANGWGTGGIFDPNVIPPPPLPFVNHYARLNLRRQRRQFVKSSQQLKVGLENAQSNTREPSFRTTTPDTKNKSESFSVSTNPEYHTSNTTNSPADEVKLNIETNLDNSQHHKSQSTDSRLKHKHHPIDTIIDTSESITNAYNASDSNATTPRIADKSSDGLNSSRSISIASDSGTSESIPSDVINTAKTYKNRTRECAKPSLDMADVTSPPLTSPSGSDVTEPTTLAPTTLKVEYVTKVWDAYITDFLLASEHIKDAAIFDRVSANCIACSLGFDISDTEYEQLQKSLCSLAEATKMGVTLKGNHYKTVLADGRRGLMAKGEGRSGCSACQTRTLVLVAVHNHTGKPARCNEEVMRLGDFFWAKGL